MHPYAIDALASAAVCVVTVMLTLFIGLPDPASLWPMAGLSGVTFGIFIVNAATYFNDRSVRGRIKSDTRIKKIYIDYHTQILKSYEIEKTFNDSYR